MNPDRPKSPSEQARSCDRHRNISSNAHCPVPSASECGPVGFSGSVREDRCQHCHKGCSWIRASSGSAHACELSIHQQRTGPVYRRLWRYSGIESNVDGNKACSQQVLLFYSEPLWIASILCRTIQGHFVTNDLGFDSLNSVKYLYLRELSEPKDNSLQLVVQEALANPSAPAPAWVDTEVPELAKILADASPIESGPGCRTFELSWKHYAAYLVTEEMVGSCGRYEDEIFTGKLLRVYAKSHFLEHLARDTGAHTGPILHYKLTCLNHLIDVACTTPPTIRVIESGSPQLPRIQ